MEKKCSYCGETKRALIIGVYSFCSYECEGKAKSKLRELEDKARDLRLSMEQEFMYDLNK